jgi:hypothetical protein
MADRRLVGVFGVGRNGSTLLMRLLDGSPGLWMHPVEFNWVAFRQLDFEEWARQQVKEVEELYVSRLVEPLDAVPVEPPRGGTLDVRAIAFLDSLRAAYDGEREWLAFKSIEAAQVDRYLELFPGLRAVHIVRDPFTAFASLKRTDMLQKRKPFWFQGDLLRTFLERRWVPHARRALELVARDGDHHLLVTYEQLVAQPEEVVARICAWLAIEGPPDPTLQTVLGGREVRDLPSNTSKDGVATPQRVVRDMASTYGYEDVLTDREREFIAFRAGSLARALGYSGSWNGAAKPSRTRLARRWLLPDQWELMNVGSKVAFGKNLLLRRAYIYRSLVRGRG